MNKWQWVFFAVQMLFQFGPRLWGFITDLIKAIQKHKNLTEEQQLALFRAPVKRKWMMVHKSVPSEQQIVRAFTCGMQRVNGPGWKPKPEQIRVAGLERYYA